MNSTAIAVQNLTKTFPARKSFKTLLQRPISSSGTEVLREVSLEVSTGCVLGLVGPNGAGKTTLLEILSTLLLPTSGRAWVCGYEVVREAAQVRKVVSYCPSVSQSFYPRLTGVGNLEFFALLNDIPPRQAKEKIEAVLNLVGMDGTRHVPFQHHSEGMKQRLSLARALLIDPAVLLLDEPTRSLDPLLQGEMRKFLRSTLVEKLGKTVLLVTHSLAEAEEVCDRLAILHQGSLISVGTPAEVRGALGAEDLATAFERAVRRER
jgi:ABC-2 type transport system ATP-binding protein